MKIAAAGGDLGNAAEAVVLALASSGDAAAFAELVRRRQSWLRNLLRRMTRDAALADDLAQQTLLQAWRKLPTLKSTAAFGGWLRRLGINEWLQYRRRQHLPLVDDETAVIDDSVTPAYHERLDLDAALATLRSEARICVVLAYTEGMSHADISSVTGLAVGTVKSHVRRGAQHLRTLLEAYGPERDEPHAR